MGQTATFDRIPGLDGQLTRQEAENLVKNDPQAAIFVLMELSAKLAAFQSAPSAPPSATPVYRKPTTRSPTGQT